MLKINFDERIEKLNNLFNIWSQRNLTIKGRITILKAKALPLVTYMSTCLYVPKHIIDKLIRYYTTLSGKDETSCETDNLHCKSIPRWFKDA